MTRLTLEMTEPETRIEEVAEFHRLIREGSRNDFIVRFVDTLTPFERVHRREYLDPGEARRILEEHQRICAVLLESDAAEAERLMLEHFNLAREYWRQLDRARESGAERRPAAAGRRYAKPMRRAAVAR